MGMRDSKAKDVAAGCGGQEAVVKRRWLWDQEDRNRNGTEDPRDSWHDLKIGDMQQDWTNK